MLQAIIFIKLLLKWSLIVTISTFILNWLVSFFEEIPKTRSISDILDIIMTLSGAIFAIFLPIFLVMFCIYAIVYC